MLTASSKVPAQHDDVAVITHSIRACNMYIVIVEVVVHVDDHGVLLSVAFIHITWSYS